MSAIIPLTLITLLFISACNFNPATHRKRVSKHPPRELWNAEQPMTTKKKQRKKIEKTISPSVSPIQKILLPTQIHPVDGTLMVLVIPPVHRNHQLNSAQKNSTHLNNPSNTTSKIEAFYIDHTEVTLEQYKKTHPKHDQTYITGKDDCSSCPAMGIDWNNADKHCRQIGKRLPTEEEWESAGRGSSKRLLLWNKTDKPRTNLVGEEDGFLSVAPVGSFPLGAGPYGALDMIGNVWEWVSTPHSPLPTNLKKKKNKTLRISKGGSWASQHHLATISYRNVVDGDIKNPTFGFRCVKPVG